MSDYARHRDLALEEKERLSFIILQHVYSLSEDPEAEEALRLGRIATDLDIAPPELVQLIAHLTYVGFLHWESTGRPIGITRKGTDYIDTLAHRRHSLRVFTSESSAG